MTEYEASQATDEKPIEIPFESLSPEALVGVIDNFIQREGTDYGVHEADYQSKSDQVMKQLKKGLVRIVFDSETASVTLMTEAQWKKNYSITAATLEFSISKRIERPAVLRVYLKNRGTFRDD